MKKIFFLILIGTLPMTSFSNSSNLIEKTIIQSNSIKAYISYQGNWHTGYIYYEQGQNGVRLIQYRFDTINGLTGFSGNFGGDENFTPLNPNNSFAVKYNFTHFIDLQGVRAYIISN